MDIKLRRFTLLLTIVLLVTAKYAGAQTFFDDFNAPLSPADWVTAFTPGAANVYVANGTLILETVPNTACATALARGTRTFSMTDGTVHFTSRVVDAYVDQGIYGDAQPRGLVSGADRNNAIEFINAYPVPSTVACRTVANGAVTETKVDIGQSVRSPAIYEIVATLTKVEFRVNGTVVATHTANIPTVPLNAYFSTGDSCAGNVPVVVDWVRIEGEGCQANVPSGAAPVALNIPITDYCPPRFPFFTCTDVKDINLDGDPDCLLSEIESDAQEKVQLWCTQYQRGSRATYKLFFSSPTVSNNPPLRIGICPYYGGCNQGTLFHSGDNDNSGKPDCFISTRWVSKDYDDPDGVPPPPGDTFDPFLSSQSNGVPGDNFLDWAITTYDVTSNFLTKRAIKHEYQVNPPLACPTPLAEGRIVDLIDVADPPLGPETEAFFDRVEETRLANPPGNRPMAMDFRAICDLDGNGACDNADLQSFQNALGACFGDAAYSPSADVDGNGCVTDTDQQALLSANTDNDGVLDFNDVCPNSNLGATVVIGDCDSGVTNHRNEDGCTISDRVAVCARGAANHGNFVSCVAQLTNGLKKAGTITSQQKGAIQSCAAQTHLP